MQKDDVIYRRLAIDSLHGYFDGMLETDTWSPCDVYGLIELLPSAQPEQVCVANVTLTDEQVKEVVEKAKNAVISVIELEPHWIPCSKRLPETYGAYLVQDVCGGIFVDYWRGYWLAKTTMVAWMELPEPYCPSCGADMRGDEND